MKFHEVAELGRVRQGLLFRALPAELRAKERLKVVGHLPMLGSGWMTVAAVAGVVLRRDVDHEWVSRLCDSSLKHGAEQRVGDNCAFRNEEPRLRIEGAR
jgi:hypothetical protein